MEVKLFPAWKNAVAVMLSNNLTYGSNIQKEQIVSLCELEPPNTIEEKTAFDLKLLSCIVNIKDQLLTNHQMLLVSNRDGSYRVIPPHEQTGYAVGAGTKAVARELQRMAISVQHTNTALLDTDQRKRHADAHAKISMLAGMAQDNHKELIGMVSP
jgi:hypothetical protein